MSSEQKGEKSHTQNVEQSDAIGGKKMSAKQECTWGVRLGWPEGHEHVSTGRVAEIQMQSQATVRSCRD